MNKVAIGANLRALRGSRKQSEIAARLGVTKAAVSQYELGKRLPEPDIMVRISKLYGKSVSNIFFRPEYTDEDEILHKDGR